jgi:hypothetical protein
LAFAEQLMAKVERNNDRCRLIYALDAGVITATVSAVALGVGLSPSTGSLRLIIFAVVLACAGLALALAIHGLLAVSPRRRVERDARAAIAIVGVLREIMPLIAESDNWDETRLWMVKMRISRFPISPSKLR